MKNLSSLLKPAIFLMACALASNQASAALTVDQTSTSFIALKKIATLNAQSMWVDKEQFTVAATNAVFAKIEATAAEDGKETLAKAAASIFFLRALGGWACNYLSKFNAISAEGSLNWDGDQATVKASLKTKFFTHVTALAPDHRTQAPAGDNNYYVTTNNINMITINHRTQPAVAALTIDGSLAKTFDAVIEIVAKAHNFIASICKLQKSVAGRSTARYAYEFAKLLSVNGTPTSIQAYLAAKKDIKVLIDTAVTTALGQAFTGLAPQDDAGLGALSLKASMDAFVDAEEAIEIDNAL